MVINKESDNIDLDEAVNKSASKKTRWHPLL